MIDFSNYRFIGTNVEVVQTHNFIHFNYTSFDDGGEELKCKNCGIMLFIHPSSERGYTYNAKNSKIMDYTCNDYLINQVLL